MKTSTLIGVGLVGIAGYLLLSKMAEAAGRTLVSGLIEKLPVEGSIPTDAERARLTWCLQAGAERQAASKTHPGVSTAPLPPDCAVLGKKYPQVVAAYKFVPAAKPIVMENDNLSGAGTAIAAGSLAFPVVAGAGLLSAVALSYMRNRSILWALVHGVVWAPYLAYRGIDALGALPDKPREIEGIERGVRLASIPARKGAQLTEYAAERLEQL